GLSRRRLTRSSRQTQSRPPPIPVSSSPGTATSSDHSGSSRSIASKPRPARAATTVDLPDPDIPVSSTRAVPPNPSTLTIHPLLPARGDPTSPRLPLDDLAIIVSPILPSLSSRNGTQRIDVHLYILLGSLHEHEDAETPDRSMLRSHRRAGPTGHGRPGTAARRVQGTGRWHEAGHLPSHRRPVGGDLCL